MAALRIVSPSEWQNRVLHLLANAQVSARALSLEWGHKEGYLAGFLRADRPPRRADPELSARLAGALAGRALLIPDELTLFNFLIGIENDYQAVIRRRFGIVAPPRPDEEGPTHGHHLKLIHQNPEAGHSDPEVDFPDLTVVSEDEIDQEQAA